MRPPSPRNRRRRPLPLIFSTPDGPDTWLQVRAALFSDLLAAAREGASAAQARVLARAEIRRRAH